MVQSASWHANRFSDSGTHFMLPKGSLTLSQPSPVGPILIQNNLVQSMPPPSLLCRIQFVLFSYLHLLLPIGLYPSGFPKKNLYAPLLFPVRATYLSHLTDLVLITRLLFGERRGHKASHNAVFSSILLPRPSSVCTSTLSYTCYVPIPSHWSCFDHQNSIWWG